MVIKVRKLTEEKLMREACEATFNGNSKQTLTSAYKSEHSPARTQMFWVTCENIPLFVASHLVRHHVGSEPFMLTHREDRDGGGSDLKKIVNDIYEEIDRCDIDFDGARIASAMTVESISTLLERIREYGGRNAPTDLAILVNAQSLIDMAKVRECFKASKETRAVFAQIKEKVSEIDPDLSKFMVKKCVYRNGLCGEPKCCRYNQTTEFRKESIIYNRMF